MIDPTARKSLSQDARRLITGQMTNDAFDIEYYESYESSNDRAVSEIAAFCYCLYSSDTLLPYRLRGHHVVDKETRSTAARSVLFLRSGLEYEWPRAPDVPERPLTHELAMFLGIPLGIALSITCIPLAIANPGVSDFIFFSIIGLLLLLGSATAFRRPTTLSDRWESYQQFGDFDVWPFCRREDFDKARETCHLLAK